MVRIGRVIWPGPVGIGAGFIKGAASFVELSQKADALEIGSITYQLREGNSGQTVWKYPDERAIRHNAGLPNPGAVGLVTQFKAAQFNVRVPWGVNVAVTPGISDNQQAALDIKETAQTILTGGITPHWLTLNVSSPDTPDPIERLQEPGRVNGLLRALQTEAGMFGAIPVWLKLSPSTSPDRLEALIEVAKVNGVEALVIGNTMIDPAGEVGGWAGEPVRAKSLAMVWQTARLARGQLAIVATGGVMEGKQVRDKLRAGASAVQVVSALLFRGREAAQIIRREYELLMANEVERRLKGKIG